MTNKRVGVALGGGVVRGLAHIGVLSVLAENGIPVDVLAGTSAGALTGAIYASRIPLPKFQSVAGSLGWPQIACLTWPTRGFVSFAKLETWLVSAIGDITFADLRIPFAAVASDLELGEPVVLQEGRVALAVHASCAVPGFVVPVELGGRLLVDGGITDNLPVSAARALGADYVIGVDLFSAVLRRNLGPLGFGVTAIETLVRRAGGGIYQADCLIAPELGSYGYLSFRNRRDLIRRGEAAASKCLPTIRADLERLGIL